MSESEKRWWRAASPILLVAAFVLVALICLFWAFVAEAGPMERTARMRPTPLDACDVVITAPKFDRATKVLMRSTDSLSVTLTGTAKRCPSATVTVFKSENGAGEVSLGTATSDAAGAWTKAITITDQVSTVISARMTINGFTTQSQLTFDADTRLPKVVVTTPVADDHGVLRVVAPNADAGCGGGGNVHVALGEPGWLADSSCSAGGQVVTSVTVTGANGGTFAITYNGSTLFSSAISSTPQTFTPTLTLTDLTRSNLAFAATNATGTTTVTDLTRVVVVTPAAVLGPDGGTPAVRLTDARRANLEVDYVLPSVSTSLASATTEVLWTPFYKLSSNLATPSSYLSTTTALFDVTVAPVIVASPALTHEWQLQSYICDTNSTAPAGSAMWCGTNPNPGPGVGDSVRIAGGPSFCPPSTPPQTVLWEDHNGCNDTAVQPTFYCSSDAGVTLKANFIQFNCNDVNATSVRSTNPQLVKRVPDCVLYDCNQNPQVWECADGQKLQSGQVRTARLSGLPPLNTYYVWVTTEF